MMNPPARFFNPTYCRCLIKSFLLFTLVSLYGFAPSAQAQVLIAPETDDDGHYTIEIGGWWGDTYCAGSYSWAYELKEVTPDGLTRMYYIMDRNLLYWYMKNKPMGTYTYTGNIHVCNKTDYGHWFITKPTNTITLTVTGPLPLPTAAPGEVLFFYDELGRLTGRSDAVNPQQTYQYDKAGNRKSVLTY